MTKFYMRQFAQMTQKTIPFKIELICMQGTHFNLSTNNVILKITRCITAYKCTCLINFFLLQFTRHLCAYFLRSLPLKSESQQRENFKVIGWDIRYGTRCTSDGYTHTRSKARLAVVSRVLTQLLSQESRLGAKEKKKYALGPMQQQN